MRDGGIPGRVYSLSFPLDRPLSKKHVIRAVDDVSFQIRRGEILGLVGESGSGKSPVARCIMNICRPYSGKIVYRGIDVCDRGQFRQNKKMPLF